MQKQPPIIQFILLLGNREKMPFINIPPSSLVHPLLRHLGNLPQHMQHFIYGCDYHVLLLQQGLQVGYNIKFCHPDTKDALLMIRYSENDVYVFLVCTESEQIRQEYVNVVSHFVGDNTLIILEEGTGKVGGLPGNVVDNFTAVWHWLQLYSRLLRLLNDAAIKPMHKNWLAFMAYLQRTSYIQSLVTEAKDENKGKINEKDSMDLINIMVDSMLFSNRKQIYKKLNGAKLARRMGVDFNNVIPHYLMYSTLGRADLIRFECHMVRDDELYGDS